MTASANRAPLSVALLTSALAACSGSSSALEPTLTMEIDPGAVEVEVGASRTVAFTVTAAYESLGVADPTVELTYHSSNRSVASITSFKPMKGFDGLKNEDRVTRFAPHPEFDRAQLTITCHSAGDETIRINGELSVEETVLTYVGGWTASSVTRAAAAIEVSCVDPVSSSCEDPREDDLQEISEGLTGDAGALCAYVDDDVDEAATVHSSDEIAPAPGAGDHTETYARVAAQITVEDAAMLQCGEHTYGRTICLDPGAAPAPGEYILLANILHAAVPREDSAHRTYGFVFDADDDPSNNYAASAAYPNDWYQDTDLWYELYAAPYGDLEASATRGDSFEVVRGSGARFIIVGGTIALAVPIDEMPAGRPPHRVTVFRHDGGWGFDGDWSGDLEPPVAGGLATF